MTSKRDPITITPAAQAHIKSSLARNPGQALRVSLAAKGCAGLKYQYELIAESAIDPADDVVSGDWGRLVLDKSSILHLIGSTLDLRADGLSTQLVWLNPWATSSCGCGESISVGTKTCGNG